jgi:hypothetical protein
VALTAGILRGIGSLLTAIATRLEANPGDPRPSLGVWGVVIALGVAVAIGVGRSPMTISQPAPLEIATDITTDITTQPETPTTSPEALPLESVPPDPDLDAQLPIAPTERDTALDSELANESMSETAIDATDIETEAEPATLPQDSRLLDDRDPDSEPLPDIPDELIAPMPASRLEPAPLPLTPEQRLIAALQDRIKMVSEEYAADAIVTTVRIDFARNHLDVELMDRWYDLEVAEQDRLALDLRDRGQQFDFYDIDIVDAAGQLVARPAAIGDAMIIVRRVRI